MSEDHEMAPPLQRILVGVDGSPAAQRAMAWAGARASETGAEVLAVHVLTYSTEFFRDASIETMTTWRRALERDLRGSWSEAGRSRHGVLPRTLLVEDDSPAIGILTTASKEDADLIVLGVHGRGNLGHRIFGSTTYRVTHGAHIPVVVVPAQ